MSNRLLQDMIHKMRDIVGRVIGVVDASGITVACSELGLIGEPASDLNVLTELTNSRVAFARDRRTYMPFGGQNKPEYAVFVDGVDGPAQKYASMLAVALNSVKTYYDEKYDKINFIKNVILENILPGDIAAKAKELHFFSDARRVVFYIKAALENDNSPAELLNNIFPDRSKDFVLSVNDALVLIKEVTEETTANKYEELARTISETFAAELFSKVNIGIGTPVHSVKDFARSFKEARIAVEVGKIFDTDKSIVSYDSLGIARLIYHLPNTLCETFLSEIFKNGSIDSLDPETLYTIQRFFENNLNVSETSRRLFVHRNTLVYRLDKISKLTGLDLREFDHAIVFKIALMVKKYLSSSPTKF